MKKYVRASFDVNDFEGLIKALKCDRRKAASFDPDTTTYEDLKAQTWESGRSPSIWIEGCEKQGRLVDDCIEDLIDTFQERLAFCKNEMDKKREYNARAEQLREILNAFLDDAYNVIDETEFGWIIEPPADSTHQDCIPFVDSVRDAIDGIYHGTGRGGSWTVWDLLSADNVRVKAGWTRDNMWYVEIQR